MSIFISIILIGLYILLLLKDRKTAGYKLHSILRLIILLLVILIALGNIFRFSYNQKPKVPVLVLVDISKSVNGNLLVIQQVVNKITELPQVKKFFSFSDSVQKWDNNQIAQGTRTDIGQALSFAQTNRPGAIVLISDGQHNGSIDPLTLSQQVQAPIYTIGIGIEQNQDLSIHSIRKPLQTFFGDTAIITTRIQNIGFNNQQVKITLERKGKAISTQDIMLSGRDALQELNFKIVPESTGRNSYSIKIDNLPGEINTANNRKDFTLQVIKNRWQILYLTNSPSFNTRFITSSLEKNETDNQNNFTVIPIIGFTGRDLKTLKPIPLDQSFNNVDVVILDNINESDLTSDVIARLRDLLNQNKGFLVLTGDGFRPQSFLKEILPFEFTSNNIQKKDIFIELTDNGVSVPIFYSENNDYLLDNTPPLWGINVASSVKPNAVVWAKIKETGLPVIGYHQYKNSKIVLINSFPLWRLGFSAIETDQTRERFDLFLKNLIRFLALKESDAFRLVTDKPDYLIGEKIIFDLLATTPDGRNWTDLDIKIDIPKLNISLPLYESNPGAYEGEIDASLPGEYPAEAIINKDNKQIGKAKAVFTINQQSVEDIFGLNSDLLSKIAEKTNGKYYTAEEFLKQSFNPDVISYKTVSYTHLTLPTILRV